jgi:hypothetical protein
MGATMDETSTFLFIDGIPQVFRTLTDPLRMSKTRRDQVLSPAARF